ncbi:Putative D-alanyl-D-alanine dipeptidase [Candidatus Glomeribacter gigasporarum BEG34]|uniref:D-alanyl-D-alanine dipeptidase n=1 Tax=Candidatus Glomeribacter gigasporarum BEG34 TaxID=1070319 RepID=G2J890_9BURK|nr:M15 family metallopeptidase [Candidatus Glomeribacter gigasporarum]CCD28987.1 Putative D-alanyl-D-alanine dipeptidase [Candidatus Glomeribacter gigasporarum BEG34]
MRILILLTLIPAMAVLMGHSMNLHTKITNTSSAHPRPASLVNRRPAEFVLLKDVAPHIVQDIRYAGAHNFVGRRIAGYEAAQCILTRQAAFALAQVQAALEKSRLGLKVYDGYRPQRSVDDFEAWSLQPELQDMKAEFYPRVDKKDFFKLGYVAKKSSHSRGSTVDLTIIPLSVQTQNRDTPHQRPMPCTASASEHSAENSLDFGTAFDCMDERSHHDNLEVGIVAQYNRKMLRALMEKYGFAAYQQEWWHYTLKNEPFPDTYFNFPVTD